MISVKTFTFNALQENTYVLWDETNAAVVVDPGCYSSREAEHLRAFIDDQQLTVVRLLNTHCHVDHVLGNAFVKHTYGVPLAIHRLDAPTLLAVSAYAPAYGFPTYEAATPDEFLDENTPVTFGHSALEVRFVPGHAPGHVAFVSLPDKFCLGGDVLFRRGIGRYDFPDSNHDDLMRSIRQQFFTLPDDTVVYPGHGPITTIGEEKRLNPYLQ